MYRDRYDIRSFLAGEDNVASISIASAKGSTPRDQDAWMLVSRKRIFRTIGGGNLEYLAIGKARELLVSNVEKQELSLPLGPDLGQCCGGHVMLHIQRLDDLQTTHFITRMDEEIERLPHVYVFGAGHVGTCLAEALSLLPVRPLLIDQRAAALENAPDGIEICLTALPEAIVKSAPKGSAFVVATHDHSLDFLIAKEALARANTAYIGMIGSKTKRATFRKWLHHETEGRLSSDRLICPMAPGECDDKRPEVIASLVAAEVMTHLRAVAKIKLELF